MSSEPRRLYLFMDSVMVSLTSTGLPALTSAGDEVGVVPYVLSSIYCKWRVIVQLPVGAKEISDYLRPSDYFFGIEN